MFVVIKHFCDTLTTTQECIAEEETGWLPMLITALLEILLIKPHQKW